MKEKFLKFSPPIITFIVSAAAGQVVIYFINKEINSNVEFITDLISRIIEILVAILNFIFVIYIFKSDQKSKNCEREYSYKLYWYQTYILPDSIKLMQYFFEEVDKLVNLKMINVETNGNVKGNENYIKYTDLHNECKRKITDILKIISPNTYKKVMENFRDFQDVFNSALFDNKRENDLKLILSEYKIKAFRILYNFEN